MNRRFIKHGLERANWALGFKAFDLGIWDVRGDWSAAEGCHSQYYYPREDVVIKEEQVARGSKIIAIKSHR